ncbi:Cytochrome c oxidase subunitC-2 [Sesamum angolense]|uniref:Cytochrome c oxidase subunitC-2 n=1 Tax=Sesamum angolense TaxID=2727404 RepID=A0AAE1X3X5_9LAMI|nr:Cytochrome c oxidase subunitC-2 [Sesamum angolense]
MAGRIPHPTLKGPSVVKEIIIGITLGIAAGSVWKMHHWNEQRKVRAFYDLLDKGEISVTKTRVVCVAIHARNIFCFELPFCCCVVVLYKGSASFMSGQRLCHCGCFNPLPTLGRESSPDPNECGKKDFVRLAAEYICKWSDPPWI